MDILADVEIVGAQGAQSCIEYSIFKKEAKIIAHPLLNSFNHPCQVLTSIWVYQKIFVPES